MRMNRGVALPSLASIAAAGGLFAHEHGGEILVIDERDPQDRTDPPQRAQRLDAEPVTTNRSPADLLAIEQAARRRARKVARQAKGFVQ